MVKLLYLFFSLLLPVRLAKSHDFFRETHEIQCNLTLSRKLERSHDFIAFDPPKNALCKKCHRLAKNFRLNDNDIQR